MTALVSAELVKLRTTRSWIGYVLALAALSGLRAAATVGAGGGPERGSPELTLDLLSSARMAGLVAFLVGITSVTAEWRHGTITRTFLATPRRERVLVSKEVAALLVGVALALVAVAVVLAVALVWLPLKDSSLAFGADAAERALQIVLETALWAALGVGVGAIVQSQTVALVLGILWVLLVEVLIGSLLGLIDREGIADYLPGRALGAFGGEIGALDPWVGGAVGLAWVVALGLLGGVRMSRRDVT